MPSAVILFKMALPRFSRHVNLINHESLKEDIIHEEKYTTTAVCWMFKKAKVAWDLLLFTSVTKLIEFYGIKSGVLVIDDTDAERSKNTTQIAKVHKIRYKKHAGFFSGQNIIFLLLVRESLSIPVGFCFYEPDPAISAWKRKDKELRKKKGGRINFVRRARKEIPFIRRKLR